MLPQNTRTEKSEACSGHSQSRCTQGRFFFFSVDLLPEAATRKPPHLQKGLLTPTLVENEGTAEWQSISCWAPDPGGDGDKAGLDDSFNPQFGKSYWPSRNWEMPVLQGKISMQAAVNFPRADLPKQSVWQQEPVVFEQAVNMWSFWAPSHLGVWL